MNKKVKTVFVGGILLLVLSACGSNEEKLDANTVNNDSSFDVSTQDNSDILDNSMVDNSMVDNSMVDTTSMSDEERAKLQVDRFVETVNSLAAQTPEDDILSVIDNILFQMSADPEQSKVNFTDGVFTTAVGIKYKLNVSVDMVTVGEVVV